MPSRAPRFRRALLVVPLSHDGQSVLLRKPDERRAWRPLQWPVPAGHTEVKALRQWRRLHSTLPAMSRGSVTGRMSMPAETEIHLYTIVILRLMAPVQATSLTRSGSWHPIARLAETRVFPADLPLLIEGYVYGWLPDGPITLDH
ncbi:hypothetical protein AAH978_21300 [Streptomyces sp. ZYX-F-203]